MVQVRDTAPLAGFPKKFGGAFGSGEESRGEKEERDLGGGLEEAAVRGAVRIPC